MSDNRKKPGWAFWAVVVVVVMLVVYPLSIGPACWISSRTSIGATAASVIYQPMMWVTSRSERAEQVLSWYCRVGAAIGWQWHRGMWIEGDGLDEWLYSPKYRSPNRDLGIE
jgi:hypothetical protein